MVRSAPVLSRPCARACARRTCVCVAHAPGSSLMHITNDHRCHGRPGTCAYVRRPCRYHFRRTTVTARSDHHRSAPPLATTCEIFSAVSERASCEQAASRTLMSYVARCSTTLRAPSARGSPRGKPRKYIFCLASGGCKLQQTHPWLGLVDLSRIPSGAFFREVHPGSEMASQNDQNKAK